MNNILVKKQQQHIDYVNWADSFVLVKSTMVRYPNGFTGNG